VVAALLLAAACGGDDKNYGDPIDNPAAAQQAKAAVEASASLATLETDPDNDAALTKVSGLYSAMQILLGAKLAAQGGDAHAVLPRLVRAAASKPLETACLTATAGRVTYTNCDLGGGTINGTISWGAGSFDIDLEMTLASGETDLIMSEHGTLRVTEESIAGALAIDVAGAIDTIHFDYSIASTWDITLAAGLATAGVLEVHGDWSVRSPQANADYDVWVKAEFDGSTVTLY
jgi:hypothetical protein